MIPDHRKRIFKAHIKTCFYANIDNYYTFCIIQYVSYILYHKNDVINCICLCLMEPRIAGQQTVPAKRLGPLLRSERTFVPSDFRPLYLQTFLLSLPPLSTVDRFALIATTEKNAKTVFTRCFSTIRPCLC